MDIKAILDNEESTVNELGEAKRAIQERLDQRRQALATLVSESEDITLKENNDEAMQDVVSRIQTEMIAISSLESNLSRAESRIEARTRAAGLSKVKYEWQCAIDLMESSNKDIKKAEELLEKLAEIIVKADEKRLKIVRDLPFSGDVRRNYTMYTRPWSQSDPLLKAFVQKLADRTGAATKFFECRGIWAFERRGASTIHDILSNDTSVLEMMRDEHLQLIQRDIEVSENEN